MLNAAPVINWLLRNEKHVQVLLGKLVSDKALVTGAGRRGGDMRRDQHSPLPLVPLPWRNSHGGCRMENRCFQQQPHRKPQKWHWKSRRFSLWHSLIVIIATSALCWCHAQSAESVLKYIHDISRSHRDTSIDYRATKYPVISSWFFFLRELLNWSWFHYLYT